MNNKLCALCGKNLATTREHVPPKGVFPKPRPSNLITVPACFECNNLTSQIDEKFMVHLGMHVSSANSAGERMFDERVLPTLRHNTKLRKSVISGIKPIQAIGQNSENRGEFFIGEWDKESHSIVLEKMIRGLFYHHYGEILGENSDVKTHWFYSLTQEMVNMSLTWASNSLGKDDLIYKYSAASKGKIHKSVWLFQFFGAHWAGGQTTMEINK